MFEYNLELAHAHETELREARRHTKRWRRRNVASQRRTTPRPTTE